MKNVTLVVLGLLLMTAVSFAAEPKVVTAEHAAAKDHMIAGIIESIKLQPASAKEHSQLSLKKDNGGTVNFELNNPAVTDASGKAVALDQLKAGEKVKVDFVKSKDGLREAKSISLN